MAYRSRGTRGSSRTAYRSPAGRGTSRRRTGASSRARRPAARGRASAAGRTVRIVIEQAVPSAVQRPDIGLMAAPRLRAPAFK